MFVVFLVLGGLCLFAAAGSKRERSALPQLPPAQPAIPSPMAVLGEYARAGALPPHTVVLCAIAEAQAMGRNDIAHHIANTYVTPVVVNAAKDANATPVATAPPAPPQVATESAPAPTMWAVDPDTAHAHPIDVQIALEQQRMAAAMPMQAQAAPFAGSDDDIQAMLDRDPRAFIDAVRRAPAMIDVPTAPDPGQLDQQTANGPPIAGVPGAAWEGFCDRLEREQPDYQSARHVGRYRQHRDRLVELGIDPHALVGSPEAQRAALEADIGDAYHHIVEGGLAAHVGRKIRIPTMTGLMPVTLSGVLGVVQAAGLEGAVNWFESQADRKRYRHTTEAFVKTNGIF